MFSIKLLAHLYIYIFLKNFLSRYNKKMADIKLGDLYLSKEESKDIIELLAKKRNIKNYKSKSSDKILYKVI